MIANISPKQHSRSSARNPEAARDWSRARRYQACRRMSGCGKGADLPEAAGPGHSGVGHVVLQRAPDPFHRIVVRAVPGAVQQLQAGVFLAAGWMLWQLRSNPGEAAVN